MKNNTIREIGGIAGTIGKGLVLTPIYVATGIVAGVTKGLGVGINDMADGIFRGTNNIREYNKGKVKKVKKGEFKDKNIIYVNVGA